MNFNRRYSKLCVILLICWLSVHSSYSQALKTTIDIQGARKFLDLGSIYQLNGEYEKAILMSDSARMNPDSLIWMNALSLRANCEYYLKRYPTAIYSYSLAIQIGGRLGYDCASQRLGRAKSKFELGDYSGCVIDCNIPIEVDDGFYMGGEARFYRGLAYIALNFLELGCEDLTKSKSAGWTDAEDALNKYCLDKN